MHVNYFSLKNGKKSKRKCQHVSTCLMWDEHFFSSIDLTHLISTVTAVSDLSSLGHMFFPKSGAKENCVSKIRLPKATFRPVPQEMQSMWWKSLFRGGCTPLSSFSPKYFDNNNKKTHGQPVSFESPLTAELEGVLTALSNRYHPDIFNSLCRPQSHLQTGNWRKRCFKTMKSSFAWWDIFIPE